MTSKPLQAPSAMVLAAGFGKRMRPITDHTPKPLIPVLGKPLIEYALEHLAAAGVTKVVVNLAHLGDQIRQHLGGGEQWGLQIRYSEESEPLETAGGITKALPLLGDEPFLVVNGDVWCDFDITSWIENPLPQDCPGRLLMVPNPPHNPEGDFGIEGGGDSGLLSGTAKPRYTFAGISYLRPEILTGYPHARERYGLGEVFAHNEDLMQAEVYTGDWCDVGTPERLNKLEERLRTE
ncbi:nucleotidyltransferase family protein [Microbulbifer bruguierae]|uniref:Nucleotidyltransferase family protein n=1 Tax=Microbulbifer bruguierae TaxID=3029061 RepID=A0ABY8NBP9_9GAMM|nr:nucleotidyltransferase family protein [Microbulbifer bruguierae]WGL15844.1 nucleotidyltransferase family protein [Microbulbifer bruguierae]